MPLLTQMLQYQNEDDDEDEEVVKAIKSTNAAQGINIKSAKIFCNVGNCPGRGLNPAETCILCEAAIHMECFLGTVRKCKEFPEGCHNEIFCLGVCCLWHGNSWINIEAVRKEHAELENLLKEQLVELAWMARVRVTHRVNKKSLQVSKVMMFWRLMAKNSKLWLGLTL
jgi:hypothetical protein